MDHLIPLSTANICYSTTAYRRLTLTMYHVSTNYPFLAIFVLRCKSPVSNLIETATKCRLRQFRKSPFVIIFGSRFVLFIIMGNMSVLKHLLYLQHLINEIAIRLNRKQKFHTLGIWKYFFSILFFLATYSGDNSYVSSSLYRNWEARFYSEFWQNTYYWSSQSLTQETDIFP